MANFVLGLLHHCRQCALSPNFFGRATEYERVDEDHTGRSTSSVSDGEGLAWSIFKLGVPYFAVLIIRILLPYFRKLPSWGS